ncbi:MAG TPA: IS66 family insertion sequence element accessory protein TnpB [Polyangiaceae bacterium]|jgi:transposase|nr:IS66 family insertion sequence element accessory protein TnpB [Polyangiaceae bacterium]
MIPTGVQVFVALEPIDMRWSFDRLAGAALERIGYDARSGALFIYFGKRRDAVKVLFFDGSGMCVFYKRLDSGVFRVPEAPAPDARHVEIDEGLLDALLDGVDLGEAPKSPRRPPRVH